MENSAIQTHEVRPVIRSYGGGAFVVSGQRYETSLILTAEAAMPWETNGELTISTLEQLLSDCMGVDIFIVGSGKTQQFFSPASLRELRQRYGVAIEVMDTGAACRTFNVLQAEDRHVAAALMLI